MTPPTPVESSEDPGTVVTTELPVSGPYDLREVALMGFGHRDESAFDGVMRMAFCLDGSYERHVGAQARQLDDDRVELSLQPAPGAPPLDPAEVEAATTQVARVISLDHDGAAFDRLCRADSVLAPAHAAAPGFRPALFYSPYEAAVWSIISARRARAQGIGLRRRLAQAHGVTFALGGVDVEAVPGPSALLQVQELPGLPADRVPRLHAVAEAARAGDLSADGLRALDPADAMARLQALPGFGPFYSALVVIRACGHADVRSLAEGHSRDAVEQLYGLDHSPSDAELTSIAEAWRPFRTWVLVMLRALSGRR